MGKEKSFLKSLFGGTSIVGTIVGGLLTGMLIQWMVRMRSKKSATNS